MPDAQTPRDLQIVDPVLTQVARQYRPDGFIYNEVAPRIPVDKDSGKYPVFTKESFFGDDSDSGDETKVSDRAPTPEISLEYSTESYFCEDYRLMVSITAKERRQAHSALKLDTSKLNALLDRMAIRREVRIATALQASGVAGGQLAAGNTAAPSTAWTQATATIEADIKGGALAVRALIGKLTNAMVMDLEVAYAIATQEDIREIIKYTVPGDRILIEGVGILPSQLHRHKVIVADVMRNVAKKGATTNLDPIWADDVRLLHLPANGGGWGIPSVSYSFTNLGEVVDRWKEEDPPVEFVRAWEDVDEKVCAPEAGYTLTSTLT